MHFIFKKVELTQVISFKKIFFFLTRQLKPNLKSQNVVALLKLLALVKEVSLRNNSLICTCKLLSRQEQGEKGQGEDANSHKETVLAGPSGHLLQWRSRGAPALVCWQDSQSKWICLGLPAYTVHRWRHPEPVEKYQNLLFWNNFNLLRKWPPYGC